MRFPSCIVVVYELTNANVPTSIWLVSASMLESAYTNKIVKANELRHFVKCTTVEYNT